MTPTPEDEKKAEAIVMRTVMMAASFSVLVKEIAQALVDEREKVLVNRDLPLDRSLPARSDARS